MRGLKPMMAPAGTTRDLVPLCGTILAHGCVFNVIMMNFVMVINFSCSKRKAVKIRTLYGIILAATLLCASAIAAGESVANDTRARRVDEIAAYLPAEPKADGARIGERAAWNRLAALPEAAKAIAEAEGLLDKPLPDLPDELYLDYSRTGERSGYEKPFFERVYRLNVFLLAECLENKGRFLPKIVECTEAICSERTWTGPAHDAKLTAFNGTPHIDLYSGERCFVLARTRDWLKGVLPDALSDRIAAECDRRVFQPYLLTARNQGDKSIREKYAGHWWFEARNNWNGQCHSCVVRAALAMIPDRCVRAEIISAAEAALPRRLDGFLSDGYCTEGMGYWNGGYGQNVMMGLSVRAATGGKVDFFRDPKNRRIMEYAYGYQLEKGKSPPFADGTGGPRTGILALIRQIYPDISSREAAGLGLLELDDVPFIKRELSVFSLRAFGQDPGPADMGRFDVLPPRSWFPEAQVLISRMSEDAGGLSFAVKGGNNDEFHNHNDLGSYSLMLDGAEMCGDPGKVAWYTKDSFSDKRYDNPFMGSYGHPVPVVGGCVQCSGAEFAAKVLKTEFTETRDIIVYDLVGAYDAPGLKSLVRTVVFNRAAKRVTVEDAVEFEHPSSFEVPVVTCQEVEGDAASGRFVLKHPGGGRSLAVSVTGFSPLKFRREKFDNPGGPAPVRLGFSLLEPQMRAVVTTVYGIDTAGCPGEEAKAENFEAAYGDQAGRIVSRIRLWPRLAPHESESKPGRFAQKDETGVWRRFNVSCPELVILKPEGVPRDTVVLAMPGGGYMSHAMTGLLAICRPLLESGRWVAVLHYRIPRREGRNIYDAPREDAARAARILRARAGEFGWSPEKIGAVGSSAGGNLAVFAATSSQDELYESVDGLDSISPHLAFAIPVYPAYILDDGATGRNENGGDGAAILPHFKFDAKTPPMFLIHGDQDFYSPMGSICIYEELHKRKIPAQLFIYANNTHGLGADTPNSKHWQNRIVDWLESIGY